MRERLYEHFVYVHEMGITPADAGKTFRRLYFNAITEDHPR